MVDENQRRLSGAEAKCRELADSAQANFRAGGHSRDFSAQKPDPAAIEETPEVAG